MHSFHFLRPAWFLALIPLAVLLVLMWRRHRAAHSWQAVVDARLMPYLLMESGGRRSAWVMAALTLGAVLADTALVVYAADPFVVTPLTNDVDTIDRQLSSLTTDLMPAQGSRAGRAIAKAQALLQQSGAVRGHVLLITDGVGNDVADKLHAAVQKLVSGGYRLSVLGVGTADGAPIPLADGGFFKASDGAIVLPKLDEPPLARLAAEGHGIYRHLAADDGDTDALTRLFDGGWPSQHSRKVAGMNSDQWREAGPWLLLPLVLLASLAFRRGYLLLLSAVVLLPVPHNAYALGWNDLWQRPDQRGAQALAKQQPQQAAKLFKDPRWRAAAHYRARDYQATLKDLAKQHGAAAAYNRGNALAHLGKYQEALDAYQDALKQDPDFKDAVYNRDLVKKWLQPPRDKKDSRGDGQRQKQLGAKQTGKQQGQPRAGSQGRQKHEQGTNPAQGKDQSAKQTNKRDSDRKSDSATARQQGDKSGKGQQNAAAADNTAQHQRQDNQDQADKRTAMNDVPPQSSPAPGQPQNESQQATAQWLRRIPDDPGGLWRRKFLYQYKREHQSQQSEAKPW
jgi:Ca-activated chloride channel family protein